MANIVEQEYAKRWALGLNHKSIKSKRGRNLLLVVGFAAAFLLVGVLAVAWIASGSIIHPPADKSPYKLSQYEFAGTEEVEFIAQDGVTLRGWFVPGSNGATVVLCHGRGGNRDRSDTGNDAGCTSGIRRLVDYSAYLEWQLRTWSVEVERDYPG